MCFEKGLELLHSNGAFYRAASRVGNYQRTCTDCTKGGCLGRVYVTNSTHEAALCTSPSVYVDKGAEAVWIELGWGCVPRIGAGQT